MIEVSPNLFVGSLADYEALPNQGEFHVIFSCKEPCHRRAVGYTSRALDKAHPEYLWAYRNGNQLALNLIDADDPKYIPPALVAEAIKFGRASLADGKKLAIVCNQGVSRSPTLAMLILGPSLHEDHLTAEEMFNGLYPPFMPGKGMRAFARDNWAEYCWETVSETDLIPKPTPKPVPSTPAHPADALPTIESVTAYLKTAIDGPTPVEAIPYFVKTAIVALERIGNSWTISEPLPMKNSETSSQTNAIR